MAALGAPVASDTFLALFRTPTLLWRVLHSVGYANLPCYFWSKVITEGQWWYDVWVTVWTTLSGMDEVSSQMDRPLGRVPN